MNEELIKERQDAANEATGQVRSLYFSFLVICVYVLITVFTTTHKDLLIGTSLKLPFVNLQVPLVAFFLVMPMLAFLLHLNLLLHFYFLAVKLRAFYDILEEDQRKEIHLSLSSMPFSYYFLKQESGRISVWIIRIIVWTTLNAFPLIVLLGVQLCFLPYHDVYITAFHQLLVVADLILLVWFWISVNRLSPFPSSHHFLTGKRAMLIWVTICVVSFVVGMLAVFCCTWIFMVFMGRTSLDTWSWLTHGQRGAIFAAVCLLWLGMPKLFFRILAKRYTGHSSSAGSMVSISRLVLGIFLVFTFSMIMARVPCNSDTVVKQFLDALLNRNLVIREQTLVAEAPAPEVIAAYIIREGMEPNEAIAKLTTKKLLLRKRDLRDADFRRSKFLNVDLTKAKLHRANLGGAELHGADLFSAELHGANLSSAELHGADLFSAELHGANLSSAKLHGANLFFAELYGAQLGSAELYGASLQDAKLHGVSLYQAKLHGADLSSAKLYGAELKETILHGAKLKETISHGTYLFSASFDYADLRSLDEREFLEYDWEEMWQRKREL